MYTLKCKTYTTMAYLMMRYTYKTYSRVVTYFNRYFFLNFNTLNP